MAKLIFTESYGNRANKFLKKHPEIHSQYEKTLKIIELNPNHPSLRLHKLKRNLSEIYYISKNISYRITIDFIVQEDTIIPFNIGTPEEIY